MQRRCKKTPKNIQLFYQFYLLQSCSLQFSDAYFYLLHFVYPYIPSLWFLSVWIFEMPSRYISSLVYSIPFHYVCRFHSWNNKLCSMWWNNKLCRLVVHCENTNGIVTDVPVSNSSVHFFFFLPFCMIYICMIYSKSSWFCIYILNPCLAFVYCNTTKLW